MLYQRKRLSDMSDLGEPGHLPDELQGALSDADLAHIGDLMPPEREGAYAGEGFFPYEPPAVPSPAVIVSPYEFLMLFTTAERIGIRTAAQTSMAVADWLSLLDHVPAVHLDDPNTIAGVQALETAGLLTAGRAAKILSNEAPA